MKKFRKQLMCLICAIMMLFLVTGCGVKEAETKVVLTTGFGRDEVFRIENMSCSLPEIMVYLTNTQNQYESVYGPQIWETDSDGITLEENVKDTVLARIARIKTMNLLAKENDVSLSSEEADLAKTAAKEYYASLNETEIDLMGIDENTIISLYKEYALADKVYAYIIKDINPGISDDEARTITVQQIFIKTYTLDGTGKKVDYTDVMKQRSYEEAVSILQKANSGEETFESLAQQYSEEEEITISFGKGEMEESFEEAAFNLETNEISSIVETQYGYHIIKCISTFDREETDANKLKIVEQRKEEVFNEEYETFVDSLTRDLNEKLWDGVTLIHNEEVTTTDFFEIYDKYFETDN